MKGHTIKKSIDIQAPKEKVWDVLMNEKFNRQWYAEFSPGSHAETDWKVGSKAKYTDDTGGGMIARVVANKANELLAVEYEGVVANGKEDYESAEAKEIKGGHETYRLSSKNKATHLDVESDMAEKYYDEMNKAWDKAIQKIKVLAEA